MTEFKGISASDGVELCIGNPFWVPERFLLDYVRKVILDEDAHELKVIGDNGTHRYTKTQSIHRD